MQERSVPVTRDFVDIHPCSWVSLFWALIQPCIDSFSGCGLLLQDWHACCSPLHTRPTPTCCSIQDSYFPGRANVTSESFSAQGSLDTSVSIKWAQHCHLPTAFQSIYLDNSSKLPLKAVGLGEATLYSIRQNKTKHPIPSACLSSALAPPQRAYSERLTLPTICGRAISLFCQVDSLQFRDTRLCPQLQAQTGNIADALWMCSDQTESIWS